MAFQIFHNIQKGIDRLLGAPRDLYDVISDQGMERPLAQSSASHQRLYGEYIADFVTAYDLADAWWQDSVEAFVLDEYDEEQAIEMAFSKRLAGPASAPESVWFFRNYWLAFDAMNKTLQPNDRVPPQYALLGWLVEEGRDDYVKLTTCMPYWPIGLDENGNWC